MTAAWPAWLLPWAVQSTLIAMLGLALLRLLRIEAPGVRLAWCQALLPLALTLPWAYSLVAPPSTDMVRVLDSVPWTVVPSSLVVGTGGASSASAPWTLAVVWTLGTVVRAAWLAAGLQRLRTWRRRAVTVTDPALDQAQVKVPVVATCLSSVDVPQPLTWGVERPTVLVPGSLRVQPQAQREAVYVHELLHVSRGDIRWVWIEEVLRTLLWPLPAVWLVVPAVRLAREQVVDAETVRLTRSRRAYVGALVWCAERTGSRLAPALPFFRRHQLLTRVASLTREVSMSRLRLVLTSCTFAVALVTGGTMVAAVAPLSSPTTQDAVSADGPGPLERTATLPTLDVPAPRRTYSVEPEWPAEARALNMGLLLRLHLVIDANGDVAEVRAIDVRSGDLPADPASAAALRALREAVITAARQWRFEPPEVAPMLVVTQVPLGLDDKFLDFVARSRRSLDALASAAQDQTPVPVGGAIPPPLKVVDVRPVYPELARATKVQGVVIVEATIERTGDVSAVRVLRSIPILDGAALDAVRQWKYEPQPHRLQMVMTINFTLAADDPQP